MPLLKQTIALVRQEIAAGKSEKEVADAGLPEIWKPWFAPTRFPAGARFHATNLYNPDAYQQTRPIGRVILTVAA